MSNFTTNFFNKHKEWLERNREYLESSNWHKQSILPKKTDEENIVKKATGKTSRKEAALASDKTIIKNIVGRLTHFIKNTPGEKHLKSNKDVVEFLLDIINIFIDNCETYLEKNKISEFDNLFLKKIEIQFQDLVFNTKIGFEDTLESLGVNVEHEDVKVKFYRDDKASLALKEPLILLNQDVKLITERIPVDWNIRESNEMLINMKPKDIPPWNYRKHFFEQEDSTIQFWIEEFNKISHGFTVGGYFIHPWLYFHLNFFKTPIPQQDGSEPTIYPDLRDNEWFFAENLKNCINKDNPAYYDKAMLVYGTRRFAKSVIMASLAHWRTLTKFNSFGTIVGGNSSDLSSLTSKIKTSMTYIEKAFTLDMIKQNWDNGETTFGIKEDISNAIIYSTLIVQNLQDGAKTKTQRTAGLAPSVSIYDEIGKYAFLKPYLAALPSFKTPYGFKCITVLAGTGGEADLSMDAMEVLNNPAEYDLLPMDWDLLESKIDPERITWKRRKFATFFPGQMAYEEGFIKIQKPFSEFLGNEDPDLANISIHVSDWEKNEKLLFGKIEAAKKMKSSKGNLLEQQRKVQYPTDPEDCFITIEGNPFPSPEIKKHKEHITAIGDVGRKVILMPDEHGIIVDEPAEHMELAGFPHTGGFVDAPVVLYEPLPKEKPPFGLYVSSLDDYKHEESDGDSVGSFHVYKREWMDGWSLRVVASFASRPTPHAKFHRQGHNLIKAFNAVCFPENEDMGFKDHLDRHHETDMFLAKGLDFAAQFNLNNNGNRAYGWNPTAKNIAFGLRLAVHYFTETITTQNEKGEDIQMLGLQRINDIGLLEETQNYSTEGNFDRLRSFMGVLMYAHYLDTIYMHPVKPSDKAAKEKARLQRKLAKNKRSNPYRKRVGKAYRK